MKNPFSIVSRGERTISPQENTPEYVSGIPIRDEWAGKKHYSVGMNGKFDNHLNYYFKQMERIPRKSHSQDEIKDIYKCVKQCERAIITHFYHLDSFRENLSTIEASIASQPHSKSPSKDETREQLIRVARISKKPLFKNLDKKSEHTRLKKVLNRLNRENNCWEKLPHFASLYGRISPGKLSYSRFLAYMEKMTRWIHQEKAGRKTKALAIALERFWKVDYQTLKRGFTLLDRLEELDLENKIFYKDILARWKQNLQENKAGTQLPGIHGLTLKPMISRVEKLEREIRTNLNDFSKKYFPYVIYIARSFHHPGVPFADILQEGNMGLLKAAEKFNHQLGYQFITYALWWIKQGINKAIADQSRTIRVPQYVYRQYTDIRKTMGRLTEETWLEPGLKQVAQKTGKSEEEIQGILQTFHHPISLNQELDPDTGRTTASLIPDIKATDPSVITEKAALDREIRKQLNTLSSREARLLEMRFGLDDGVEYTLDQVAGELHVTRERVRQIEVKALKRLREMGESNLRPYLTTPGARPDYCHA